MDIRIACLPRLYLSDPCRKLCPSPSRIHNCNDFGDDLALVVVAFDSGFSVSGE